MRAVGSDLHQAVEQRLGLGVDPVEILEDQQQRLLAGSRAAAVAGPRRGWPGGGAGPDRAAPRQHPRRARPAAPAGPAAPSPAPDRGAAAGRHLLTHGGMVVAALDPEVAREQVDDREPGRRLAVRDRAGLQHPPAARAVGVGRPPRPAATCRRRAPPPGPRPAPGRPAPAPAPARSPPAPPPARRTASARAPTSPGGASGPRPAPTSSNTSTGCVDPLDLSRPERAHLDEPFDERQVAGSDERGAGRGKLLHPRGQVDGLAHRRVIQVPIVRDQPHDHPAAVEPDADLDGGAVRSPGPSA